MRHAPRRRLEPGWPGAAPWALALLGCTPSAGGAPALTADPHRAPLQAIAAEMLPESGDAAAILRLEDGRLIFEHHPDVLSRDRVSPGSVVKLITAYALLRAGREDTEYRCGGSHTDRRGQVRPCWLRSGHGRLRLRTALAMSCNAWFYQASEDLQPQELIGLMAQFGLGAAWPSDRSISTDLVPAVVPASEVPDLAIGDHPLLAVTPLSLLRMVSIVATRGSRITPARDGPASVERLALDRSALEIIALGMEEATRGGTLEGTFEVPNVAAKSGTAKRLGGRGTRGFVVGYLPADAPRFAFVVVKDRGRGAKDAGPAAAAMARALTPRGAR